MRGVTAAPAAALAAALATTAVLLASAPARLARAQDAEPVKTSERRAASLRAAFARLAARAAPAVVEVRSLAGDELGLAVAIRDGTLLLTCRSILETVPGPEVVVRAADGRAARATVLGRNEAYDVALLRLRSGPPLPALPLGRSADLGVGSWVVAVGTTGEAPLAVGVVSALDRRVEPRREVPALDVFGLFSDGSGPRRAYESVIQHDAPIDASRHAGSPLLDSSGRLVGINVASVYRGSSFAAPIDAVSAFLDDLAAGLPGPPLRRPAFLGVSVGPIDREEIRAAHGLRGPGARVVGLAPGAAAERAGIREGDAILEIEGEPVHAAEHLGHLVRLRKPGDTVRLRVLREGREIDLRVTLGERPAE